MNGALKKQFPNLHDIATKTTSGPSAAYNCIAWAFKDSRRVWWPDPRRAYWPLRTQPTHTTMESFDALFASLGWQETSNRSTESGYEKIALYALRGVPTHASRLLDTGMWTSKLGQYIDISHDITELEGPEYGQISKIYRKPLP